MTNNDDFQKKAFELWMAVTMFMSTYAGESNNIVKKVSSMLPYATDLQNFWSAYQSAQSNSLIRNLHTKIRARVRLMRDLLEQSIASCGDNQKLLDKYSENQNYIERKLNDLYSMIPKEPRKVKEPEQLLLDFIDDAGNAGDGNHNEQQCNESDDCLQKKSDNFLKRLNELRVSVNGFISSYQGMNDSVIDYVSDMNCSIRIMDGLWRRYMREQGDASILDVLNDSMRKCIGSLRSQCEMSVLVRDSCRCSGKYLHNHEYVLKKLDNFIKSFPDDARRLKRT
jgi:hypothetical protein